jgi:hypothetical protein
MRNSLFRFIAKFRETTSLFCETRNLFRFVFREIRNETSFAGNPMYFYYTPVKCNKKQLFVIKYCYLTLWHTFQKLNIIKLKNKTQSVRTTSAR